MAETFIAPDAPIAPYGIANVRIALEAPENSWSLAAYLPALFPPVGVTGEYLASSTSGLYTAAFYNDPRVYGVGVSARF